MVIVKTSPKKKGAYLSNMESSQRPLTATLLAGAGTSQREQKFGTSKVNLSDVFIRDISWPTGAKKGIFHDPKEQKKSKTKVKLYPTPHSSSAIEYSRLFANGFPESSKVTWI